MLAGLLAAMAERLGGDGTDAEETGRAWGQEAARRTRSGSCVDVLVKQLTQLGFDPAVEPTATAPRSPSSSARSATSPRRTRAGVQPAPGICAGALESAGGGSMEHFSTLYDHDPCHVRVVAGSTTA